jgi:hypothetical protein
LSRAFEQIIDCQSFYTAKALYFNRLRDGRIDLVGEAERKIIRFRM